MRFARCISAVSIFVFGALSIDAVEAAKPEKAASPKKLILAQFDANGDGKLGRIEKAAARPTIAKLREQRALNRNQKALSGIK